MPDSTATDFLRRAIRLAMAGRGRVEPNPMVGCVLVKNGVILGEGHHARYGGPHAEPNALADCRARGDDPRGATAYVTLEPCCHTNKKTPPCAPRLIEAGIARVVVGCPDPNPDVDGRGVAMLRAAGVRVDDAPAGIAAECRQLIAPFRIGRAYVTLKWAECAGGHVAGPGGRPVRITSDAANAAVHRLRTRCDGIAVGVNTVLTDDPRLTIRDVSVVREPIRIVLDRRLRTPPRCRLLTESGRRDVYLLCDRGARSRHPAEAAALEAAAAVVDDGLDPDDAGGRSLLDTATGARLRQRHLLVEPGPTLARSMLPWADRVWVLRSGGRLSDGPGVPRAAAVPASYVETGRLTLGPDVLTEYLNRDAHGFAAAAASADFESEAARLATGGTADL